MENTVTQTLFHHLRGDVVFPFALVSGVFRPHLHLLLLLHFRIRTNLEAPTNIRLLYII